MIYTGVGARSTPPEVQATMVALARTLAAWGWTLRSGHAPGADQAFERGARERAEIYLPWSSYEGGVPIVAAERHARPTVTAYRIASEFHPVWERLPDPVRALHARNVHEVLGVNCNEPADMLVCFTPCGSGNGGTGQAIRIAKAYGIPVFDVGRPGALADATAFVVDRRS